MLLNEIVSNALDMMTLGEIEFTKCYRIAQRCIRQMKWDFIGNLKPVELTVLPNMTCKLPDDFVSERKIGVYSDVHGEIDYLDEDSNLSLLDSLNQDRLLGRFSSENIFDDIDFLVGDNAVDLHGTVRQKPAGYRIDRKMNLLVLDPNFNYRTIHMEYIGSTTEGGNCEVPEMVSEAIMYFVIWQYNFAKKGVPYVEKQSYENKYYTELANAKARIAKITKGQMRQNSRIK